MENKNSGVVLLDTSILIDFFRKTKKERTFFVYLSENYTTVAVSIVTKFEIYIGSTPDQKAFWDSVFSLLTILPFDENGIDIAINISRQLKKVRKSIEFADLLIAATARQHDLPFATLNNKHFEKIENLALLPPFFFEDK